MSVSCAHTCFLLLNYMGSSMKGQALPHSIVQPSVLAECWAQRSYSVKPRLLIYPLEFILLLIALDPMSSK